MDNHNNKSVFISYRRKDILHARPVYEHLQGKGYNCFLDKDNTPPGEFGEALFSEIKSRTYFLLILTPDALKGVSSPDDWLGKEIRTALNSTCTIVPLMFDDFEWNKEKIHLSDELLKVSGYQSLPINHDTFQDHMYKLRDFLEKGLPVSSIDKNVTTQEKLTFDEYIRRAQDHDLMGNDDFAIADFTQTIKMKPNDPTLYYQRGCSYKSNSEYDKAIMDFREAIRLNPKYSEAYRQCGIIYYLKSEYDKALHYINQAILINEKSAFFYYDRALIYAQKKEYKYAIKDLTKSIELLPGWDVTYDYRSEMYEKTEAYHLAIDDLTEAIRLNLTGYMGYTDYVDYTYHLKRGEIYEKIGDIPNAISDYQMALEINPDNVILRNHLKDILTNTDANKSESS